MSAVRATGDGAATAQPETGAAGIGAAGLGAAGLGAARSAPGAVACRDVSIEYSGVPVVRELTLDVAASEAVALLGPSGSGKSSLLYAIAGFLAPAAGEIWIGGRLVASRSRNEPPEARGVGVVFQHFALWPHLDALDTVAYPIRRRGVAVAEARRQAREILERMGLARLAHRRPAELSGGEQQRVGLARALARRPLVYLLDEPTAHLDTALRAELQSAVAEQRRREGVAAIYATHDVGEAFGIADRIVVLREGAIVQQGSPAAIYEQPVDAWTARLTGPAAILEAPFRSRGDGTGLVRIGATDVEVRVGRDRSGPPRGAEAAQALGPEPVPPLELGPAPALELVVRPEWASIGGPLHGVVQEAAYRGAFTDYRLATEAGIVVARAAGPPLLRSGEVTGWRLERVHPIRRAS